MCKPLVDSREMVHWPEWKALSKRLGIADDLSWIKLVLTIEVGSNVIVEQTYQCLEEKDDLP